MRNSLHTFITLIFFLISLCWSVSLIWVGTALLSSFQSYGLYSPH
jgi:hypothetical protein